MGNTTTPSAAVLEFWRQACVALPEIDPASKYDVWFFGDSEQLAHDLAELVLKGQKRATAGLLSDFNDKMPLPRLGGLSLVTDFRGAPLMLLRTTQVDIVRFDDVSADFAAVEGEGDASLEYWRSAHLAYFRRVSSAAGLEFSGDTKVVCERFDLLYPRSEIS